jgi:peptidoglycan-N-acetylglucosamine deacetylase
MQKPIASLSLDLDNKWSYQKTHGDRGWEKFPSYLDMVVPRLLGLLDDLGLKVTVFVVGQDAALARNREPLASIAAADHEIGNHSFHHEPWLHLYSSNQIEEEISTAEETIFEATGVTPTGFRGPGYSVSPEVIKCLARRGYRYDASTLPTVIGPLARAYYFFSARLSRDELAQRKRLFGAWTDGLRPLRPYWWQLESTSGDGRLLEIPVTTLPMLRVPIHFSYLLYLRGFSRALAWSYWSAAMRVCRLTGVEPSLLLHPLDVVGGDEEPELGFFPAMSMRGADKRAFVRDLLADFAHQFRVLPLGQYAALVSKRNGLRVRTCAAQGQAADAPQSREMAISREPALTATPQNALSSGCWVSNDMLHKDAI